MIYKYVHVLNPKNLQKLYGGIRLSLTCKICDKFRKVTYDTPHPPLTKTNYVNMQDNYVKIST